MSSVMVVGANSSHWCWVLFDCSAAENMCGCHWFAVVPVLGQLSVVLSCGFTVGYPVADVFDWSSE